MQIQPVDPRDTSWEVSLPAYRVYFWKRRAGSVPEGVPTERVGYSSREFELTGFHNIREVLAWADENAGSDRTYTLYAVVSRGEERGLVRLYGVDPTRHKGDEEPGWPGEVYY
jgi:hypothetical protein